MGLVRADWPQFPIRAVNRWILAADLGQSFDPTALCVLNHRVVPGEWKSDDNARQWCQERSEHFDCRHLERIPLGTSYPAVVQHVASMLTRPPLNAGCTLVIDETGVGRAVGDIFDSAGLAPKRITITSGAEVSQHDARTWHVPKGVLISGLDARLHTGELKIAAGLSDAGALAEELKDFQRKVRDAGRATYAARTGAHDDLVLAVALALWWATARVGEFSVSELRI